MRTCIVCGCTDVMACHSGCAWSKKIGKDKGICTQCPTPKKLRSSKLVDRRNLLQSTVKRTNETRTAIARSYMAADRKYFEAVQQLRAFERRAR